MIAEKLRQVAENLPRIYEAGKKPCLENHFVAALTGDGTDKLNVPIFFEPDILSISGYEPGAYKKANALAQFYADLSGFGFLAATSSVYNAAGSLASTAMTTETVLNRFDRQADGTLTITNIRGTSDDKAAVFQEGVSYVVMAARYEKKPLRERIEDYVASLTGSGTAMLSRRKVFEAFTQAQWDALIATKPNWTFTLN